MKQSVMQLQDGPGSAAHSPLTVEPDGTIVPFTTRTQGNKANVSSSPTVPTIPDLPDPAIGGQGGALGRLGYSTGFLAFRRKSAFTGRTLVRKNMGVHPAVGPVGFSTRSQHLRNGVEALFTDYTPSAQAAAQEIVRNF